jgi:putative aminopeptidase FrvX
MAIPELLQALLTADGPSGYEGAPAEVWRAAAAKFATVETDTMGNSFARVPGTVDGGPSVAIVGHIDEIGLIVTHIDDEGFLWFASVGGWDPQILIGQRVVLQTREARVPGVVGKKPIHLLSPDERKKVPELKELHIDIGAKDGDEARELVRVGDTAVIDAAPVELPNGRAASKAMDNRLGAYVALEAARLVAEAGGAPGEVIAVAAVQEEIGCFGAGTSAYTLNPTAAIAVDVTHATDAPGIEFKQLGKHPLGSGPVLERGSILHPFLFEHLYATGESEAIPFTVSSSGGKTWTDADAMFISRAGIPVTLVSFPLRYMHSPVEIVEIADVDNAAKLIAAACRALPADLDLKR